MFSQHLLEQTSHYLFLDQVLALEVNPQVDLSLWELKLMIFLEKGLDERRFVEFPGVMIGSHRFKTQIVRNKLIFVRK